LFFIGKKSILVNLSKYISLFEVRKMKKKIHPEYKKVLFVDSSTNHKFLCGTTLSLKDPKTSEFEGKEYPVYEVSVSSASHPFYTGSQQLVDSEGRVDKFMKRYGKK